MAKDSFLRDSNEWYASGRIRDSKKLFPDADCWYKEDFHITFSPYAGRVCKYYLEHQSVINEPDVWDFYFYFDYSTKKKLSDFQSKDEWYKYTSSSLRSTFSNYPYLRDYVIGMKRDDFEDIYAIGISKDSEHLYCIVSGKMSEYREKRIATHLFDICMGIKNDLEKFILNRSALVKEPERPITQSRNTRGRKQMPEWARDLINGTVRMGIKTAAAFVGSNIDTNFDIGNINWGNADSGVDVDFDADFDIDYDSDFDSPSNNGYNVSFGSQKETLTSQGGGQHLDVTIEKEPGTANRFCISSDKGTVHNVSGGDMWVKINGINYKLPKLKG